MHHNGVVQPIASHPPQGRRALWQSLAATVVIGALCVATVGARLVVQAPARELTGARAQPVRAIAAAPERAGHHAAPRSAGGCIDVPILVYHYVRVNPVLSDAVGWNLSVTPAAFQAQMDWLRIAGGHTVTLAQVMAAASGGAALPAHPVVLTFDDGYSDFATAAAPVLEREGFVATDFVVGGFIGRTGYMTAAQVRAVAAAGMVIGAHTMHHVDLTADPQPVATAEIVASKQTLQWLLHTQVSDFAYPYGYVNAEVARLVAQAGFRDAVTMYAGTRQCANQSQLLHRVRVGGSDSVWSFAHSAGIAQPPASWVDPGPRRTHTAGNRGLPRRAR